MAHIKLEAALETSNKWNITSVPLLHWQSKLKCRQRLQEEEEVKQGLQSSSFPKRVAHTALSFVSSKFSSGNDDKLRGSTTFWRFERFADGASEFLSLWLSESTDIVGVVVRCLQLFIPYLSSTAETVKTKLTQMPMQDLCWVFDAYSVYGCDEQQNSLHTMCSKWFRPNPFCCQQQNHCHLGEITMPKAVDCLSRNVEATSYQMSCKSKHGSAYLRVEKTSWRATTRKDKVGKRCKQRQDKKVPVQGWTGANRQPILQQVCLINLNGSRDVGRLEPLLRSAAAISYQMLWKSKHCGAYLQVEKISWRLTTGRGLGGKRYKQQQGKKDTVIDWVQKEKRLPLPLLFKNNPCVHHCPIMLISSQYHRSLARKIKSCSMFNA
ncbi:unnamed protein product [Miscanthus lutarioriparius]|uniref:Uncharacterized protein n=1 Tax=Miscanthus lutarioriparius TaxID=422564 RepID=A0A811Q313_9POAL|nr:unnamed protein product [Miscanthus lutarioriparius]